MTKAKPPATADIVGRLLAIKLMVAGMKDAMPSTARELRREVCESIDDLIEDITK